MRFLNPKTDFAFRKIFGSETSRDILLSFLNAVLGLEHPYLIKEARQAGIERKKLASS